MNEAQSALYQTLVENMLVQRHRAGVLISSHDFMSGAMLAYIDPNSPSDWDGVTPPLSWIFAPMSGDDPLDIAMKNLGMPPRQPESLAAAARQAAQEAENLYEMSLWRIKSRIETAIWHIEDRYGVEFDSGTRSWSFFKDGELFDIEKECAGDTDVAELIEALRTEVMYDHEIGAAF